MKNQKTAQMLSNLKAVAQCVIALFLYLIGYNKGKQKQEIKTLKGKINAVKKAKQARDNLNNSNCVKRLHDKYKR